MQNTPTWSDRQFYCLIATYAVVALCCYGALGFYLLASEQQPLPELRGKGRVG
jgi:hypothetical protein